MMQFAEIFIFFKMVAIFSPKSAIMDIKMAAILKKILFFKKLLHRILDTHIFYHWCKFEPKLTMQWLKNMKKVILGSRALEVEIFCSDPYIMCKCCKISFKLLIRPTSNLGFVKALY
jgi:hypothetical protein